MQKTTFFKEFKSYTIITFFLALYSVSIVGFIINSGIVGGGLTGFGTMIYYLSGKLIPVGYSTFLINSILLLIALKVLGKNFGAKTIYAIFLISLFITLAQRYITEPFLDDVTLSTVIGGAIVGFCLGSVFNQGGSSGGTDIVAMIVNKYREISPGRMIFYMDIFIIGSAFMVFHFFMDKTILEAFRLVVYGFISIAVSSYTIDWTMLGQQQSVQMFIFSKKHDDIASAIGTNLHRGVTLIHGKGWYTKEETEILLVIVRKTEMRDVLQIVKRVDPHAFTSIGTVTDVYGQGFSQIKN
ncbi:MAG: YitT family protein [Bacteroidales bacterium]|nr:YitT family protein [Bacteroidales bacterium]